MSEESKNLMKMNSFIWSPPDNLSEEVSPLVGMARHDTQHNNKKKWQSA